jgi:hypothetical protein
MGFVSNSSAASFVIKFKTELDDSVIRMIAEAAGYFDLKQDDLIWTIDVETTMFNDYMDLPAWKLIRALVFGSLRDTFIVEFNADCEENVWDFRSWPLQQKLPHDFDKKEIGRAYRQEAEFHKFMEKSYQLMSEA